MSLVLLWPMAVCSVTIESRKWQQDPIWGQVWTLRGGGLPCPKGKASPARLTFRNQPLANKEVTRCSTCATQPRPMRCVAALHMQIGCSAPAENEMGLTSATVSKLCQQGQLSQAVEALGVLVHIDCYIPKAVFYTVLKECVAQNDGPLGRRVHALTVKKGLESDTFLCNHILRMYASHARLQEAVDVFYMVARPDAFMWSSIISAYVKHGQDKQAIQLYHGMRRSGVKPDGHVFVAALQACAKGADLISGQQVHADFLDSDVEHDMFICSCLVDMYAKCGSVDDARRVFDGLVQKNVVTWNAMISGYSQQGMGQEALRLYSAMLEEGIAAPNSVTFACVLQACASVGVPALETGMQLHAQIREQGLQAHVFVASSLVNMYAKCGSLEDAERVFSGLDKKNVVTWSAMIAGYSQQGKGPEALGLYSAMQGEGLVAPDSVTFVSLLQACASVGNPALETGKQMHVQMRERGFQDDVFAANSLVNMYAKCGSIEDAQCVFDRLGQKNVVSWNAMIGGYSQQDMGHEALGLYRAMQDEGICAPDSVTFVSLLQACAGIGNAALEKGKQLHAQIKDSGFQANVFVANSLVNMYAKCGSLEDAQVVFTVLGQKDVVTWNAMIAAYSQQGMGQDALRLYRAMEEEGLAAPDSVTFVSLLQACANVAALHLGRQLHAQVKQEGLQADVLVAGSLINMYGKCGSMADAQQVFDALPRRDMVAWTALVAGYTRQGDSDKVFDLIRRMREDGVQPDGITFLSALTVCGHTGLVNEGREYFDVMSRQYNITPTADHYSCMVGLLARAGLVDEALALVQTMPVLPTAAVWHTLLGACQKWGNVELGLLAFDESVKLDKTDPAAYVLMSNIYISAQMWEEAREVQARRIGIGAWKQPGQSWWTDMDGLVHSFLVGEKNRPGSEAKLNDEGYGRHVDYSLANISHWKALVPAMAGS